MRRVTRPTPTTTYALVDRLKVGPRRVVERNLKPERGHDDEREKRLKADEESSVSRAASEHTCSAHMYTHAFRAYRVALEHGVVRHPAGSVQQAHSLSLRTRPARRQGTVSVPSRRFSPGFFRNASPRHAASRRAVAALPRPLPFPAPVPFLLLNAPRDDERARWEAGRQKDWHFHVISHVI